MTSLKTSIKTITYLSDTGCLEIQGASLPASKPRRLPSVISANEVQRILQVMDTRNQVIFTLLYGAGLRINECLRLRVKDFDFDNGCITVHDGKGGKSRNSLLPTRLIPAIK
ncbi:Integrase/recombinase [Shigella sonnei]|nr:Integrase/recombinase [Shigella sonnei]SRJ20115.1 Integrase/recombinase [Shigella sonnei]SRJ28245.1 Integrase/recombinase [Shigella sonnei]SVG45295.1 Integrase/recombinase [Shigella sonnei]SVG88308.1 Integrase/recombinase [Shigella sonnei]